MKIYNTDSKQYFGARIRIKKPLGDLAVDGSVSTGITSSMMAGLGTYSTGSKIAMHPEFNSADYRNILTESYLGTFGTFVEYLTYKFAKWFNK
ncbi:hypothetical protein J6N69_04965 [bacterium]|nr:hypothetical protein [bacterium]